MSKTNLSWPLIASCLCIASLNTAWSQPLTVTTLAGRYNHNGYINAVGTNAQFQNLNDFSDLASDQNGFLYVVDGNTIRRISPDGLVVTLAGNPNLSGYVDATGTDAQFSSPAGIAADANGNVYVADEGNYVIRKITPAGVVSTVAGDGTYGYVDSANGTPKFQEPNSVALDSAGNIYVADYVELRMITPAGVVSTLAGSLIQEPGFDDGNGTNAKFVSPFFLAADASQNIYVAMGDVIRQVTLGGGVTTLAGSGNVDMDGIGANAGFDNAYSIAVDKTGGLYVADSFAGTIRYVTPAGVVTTVAGLVNRFPYPATDDGVGSAAFFYFPQGIAVDAFGNVDVVDGGAYTVLQGAPPSLSSIGSFSESPGGTPARSSNPWQFTAYYTNVVSDLRLRVQSTLTTNDAGSWSDLPGNPYMTDVGGNWNLNITDVPAGTRYFRVIASAPGYADSPSAAAGPENVLGGIAPFGDYSIESGYPYQTGVGWTFTIAQSSVIPGLNLRVQSGPASGAGPWTDLSGGGQMGDTNSIWTLVTTNVPVGAMAFRVVASAPTYFDRISAVASPYSIVSALPTVNPPAYGSSGNYTLQDVDATFGPTPSMVYFQAVTRAVAEFGCSDTIQYNSAVNLAGQQYAAAILQVAASQHVAILAINVGPNAAVELKGTIHGDVALIAQDGSSLIGQDGSGVVSNDGGSLTFDQGSAAVAAIASSLIAQDGSSIIFNGGDNVISPNGGNVISPNGGNVIATPILADSPRTSQGHDSPPPTQPTFTGVMTVDGNYSQFFGSSLIVAIAGTNTASAGAQQYDQLSVTGQANLVGGRIAFGLFDPNDQTDRTNVFQPPVGATFDVIVASNIVMHAIGLAGPIWGDGLFFSGGVVTRADGLQALRLTAVHVPPNLFLQNAGPMLQLAYATNYTGYSIQSSTDLSSTNWTTISTGTNALLINPTNGSQFFRLSKP